MISLSPTKLDTFYGCKRLYLYRYIYKLPTEEKKHFFIGNVAHKVLELFHTEAKNLTMVCDFAGIPGKATNDTLKDTLMDCWKKVYASYEFSKKIAAGMVTQEDAVLIRDMLKSYMLSLRGKKFPSVLQMEKLYKINMGSFMVFPKADRIDSCGPNTYKIVDYKTSQRPASEKEELESAQIPTYGLVVKQNFKNADKIYGEYQYLRCLDKGGVHVHEITEDAIKNVISKYKDVAGKLEDPDLEFCKNKKYKFCRSCEFSAICAMDDCDSVVRDQREAVKKFKNLGVNYELQKDR